MLGVAKILVRNTTVDYLGNSLYSVSFFFFEMMSYCITKQE